jgi:hypothetical protein
LGIGNVTDLRIFFMSNDHSAQAPRLKYTPGPWDYYDPCDTNCGWPCTQDGCPDNHPTGVYVIDGPSFEADRCDAYGFAVVNEADARLIAAAPDLLEALKNLLDRVERNGGIGEYKGGPAFVVKAAKSAIAKAEGQAIKTSSATHTESQS